MVKPKKPKTFSASVDGSTYVLELVTDPEKPMSGEREYVVLRDGGKVARVLAKGTSFYYVYASPTSGAAVGYVQHNRDEAIWSAALLVSRGIEPLKPDGVAQLREIAAKPRR